MLQISYGIVFLKGFDVYTRLRGKLRIQDCPERLDHLFFGSFLISITVSKNLTSMRIGEDSQGSKFFLNGSIHYLFFLIFVINVDFLLKNLTYPNEITRKIGVLVFFRTVSFFFFWGILASVRLRIKVFSARLYIYIFFFFRVKISLGLARLYDVRRVLRPARNY